MMVNAGSLLILGVGSQDMTILPSGNVGIGTALPTQSKLIVIDSDDTSKQIVFSDNATYYGSISHNAGTGLNEYRTEALGGHAFYKGTETTPKVIINTAGNVGIGTSSPYSALHIDQPSNDRIGGLYIERNGSTYGLSAFVNSGGYGIIGSAGSFTRDILTMNLNNGNVGIGVTGPNAQLDVGGTTTNQVGVALFTESSTTAYLTTGFNARPTHTLYGINTTNTYVGTRLSHAGNTEFFHGTVKGASNGEMKYVFQGYNGTAYQEFGYIDCYTTNAGSLIMSGDVVAFSDKKLKKNIKTLDGSKVYKMRGVSFDRIDTGKKSSGVIAQEMQEVAPELVNESGDTLGVAYGNISGYLIEAIKELEARVKILENK